MRKSFCINFAAKNKRENWSSLRDFYVIWQNIKMTKCCFCFLFFFPAAAQVTVSFRSLRPPARLWVPRVARGVSVLVYRANK